MCYLGASRGPELQLNGYGVLCDNFIDIADDLRVDAVFFGPSPTLREKLYHMLWIPDVLFAALESNGATGKVHSFAQ